MRTIAHRSLLLALALFVPAAPAGAVEVASIDRGSLHVRDDRGADLCVSLNAGESEYDSGTRTCGRAPWRPRRAMLLTWLGEGERVLAGGAVPAAVTRAEAELVDGRRIGFDTVAGRAYRGRYAGKLRFFLAALPLADPRDDEAGGLLVIRFFGADGTLLGAETSDRIGSRIGPTRRLLREGGRRGSITVSTSVVRNPAPTPLALDRFEDMTCLFIRNRSGGGSGQTHVCREPGPNRPDLAVLPEAGCGPARTVVAGFVGDAVSGIRLRLGSGRVREVRARTLPAPGGGTHRYVATVVPRGEAVRSVEAVGADAGYDLEQAPGGLECIGDGGGVAFVSFFYGFAEDGPALPPGSGEQVAAEAGGHRLLVRDAEAERLCSGVDRLRADGSDCALPPVTADWAFATVESGVVSAVLPSEVARVRLPGGRVVATVEGGYTGRYAGTVRFLMVEADIGPTGRLRMLDASGAAIGTLWAFGAEQQGPPAPSVRLAAGRGWRLSVERVTGVSCLTLRMRGFEPYCGPVTAGDVNALAGCTPRRAVIYGALDRGVRAVAAVLRGGRALRARIVRIPRRVGGGRAFVLALPRAARVKALRFDGRAVTFPLLPAADQCGYRVFAPFLSPASELQFERR
jgi:hypothetical protein